MGLELPAGLAARGFLERITKRGAAILATHLLKGALHQLVPGRHTAFATLLLTGLAILAAHLAILTSCHLYIKD
jgi:hypothetical protein